MSKGWHQRLECEQCRCCVGTLAEELAEEVHQATVVETRAVVVRPRDILMRVRWQVHRIDRPLFSSALECRRLPLPCRQNPEVRSSCTTLERVEEVATGAALEVAVMEERGADRVAAANS